MFNVANCKQACWIELLWTSFHQKHAVTIMKLNSIKYSFFIVRAETEIFASCFFIGAFFWQTILKLVATLWTIISFRQPFASCIIISVDCHWQWEQGNEPCLQAQWEHFFYFLFSFVNEKKNNEQQNKEK